VHIKQKSEKVLKTETDDLRCKLKKIFTIIWFTKFRKS